MSPILQNNRLLLKYSNAEILAYFTNSANSPNQLSAKFSSNALELNLAINEIALKHINFRDALQDPNNPINAQTIEEHHKYLWNPNEILNGQMFSDFGFNGNDIQKTHLSGYYFSSTVDTKKIDSVLLPQNVLYASPNSFRQGLEVTGAKIHSSVMDVNVHYIDDNPSNIVKKITIVCRLRKR